MISSENASPYEMLVDKVSVVNTSLIGRRLKDFYDLYIILNCFYGRGTELSFTNKELKADLIPQGDGVGESWFATPKGLQRLRVRLDRSDNPLRNLGLSSSDLISWGSYFMSGLESETLLTWRVGLWFHADS